MLQKQEPIKSGDFSKGLVTRDDMLNQDFNQSPNTMDVKWFFDGAVGKRLGTNTTNTTAMGGAATTAGWTIDTNSSLSTSLQAYWKLDEASGSRTDQVGSLPLTDFTGIPSIVGLRNQAANFAAQANSGLYLSGNSSLSVSSSGSENFSMHCYVYLVDTATFSTAVERIITFTNSNGVTREFTLFKSNSGGNPVFRFDVNTGGGMTVNALVAANSFGSATSNQWYSIVCWSSGNSHIGISVNLSVNTALITGATQVNSSGSLALGFIDTSGGTSTQFLSGRIDEFGFWKKVLSIQERSDLYANGSGNTYSGAAAGGTVPWASFDFGASSIRWLTVALGTGLYASSNRGTTFVSVATSRTATFQYFERSKNVLIATSDAFDVPLYWAGSAGTFALALAPGSAPSCKYSVNYNGFLFLLNSSARPRGVFYADENLQTTDPWTTSFDIPSSLDDEITSAFILNRFLYISTRYRIYRLQFVGGNPDFSYLKVKDFGYVSRTVKIIYINNVQVAVGLDWDKRLRGFDGFNDFFVSNSIENDNKYCDFAMSKVSRAGSGLIVSFAELDTIEQEYRLHLAIGANSTNTTHSIQLNTRTLSMYPYSNQNFNTMVMAESNNTRALMAFDRSGFCHILNSGNLDSGVTAINEVYDSPLLFGRTPVRVSKAHELDLFFKVDSAGTVYHQDRTEMGNVFAPIKAFKELVNTDSSILVRRTIDLPSVQNIYQFRLTSSSGTANPWKLVRVEYLQESLGFGKGGAA